MKYEMIFGDEALFNSASDDAVLAIKDTTSGRIHFFTNDGWIKSGLKHERYIGTSDNEIAMRSIIKDPKRWTWEDKKAGRLPDVGAKCSQYHSVDERTVLSVTDKYVGIERDNSAMKPYFVTHAEFLQYYIPIESPEEKAGRLPDIGSKAVSVHGFYVVDILAVRNGCVVACNSDISDARPCVFTIDKFLELYTPIETLAEKAQRLREEWVSKATFMTTYEIYDDLLSGELKAPGVE